MLYKESILNKDIDKLKAKDSKEEPCNTHLPKDHAAMLRLGKTGLWASIIGEKRTFHFDQKLIQHRDSLECLTEKKKTLYFIEDDCVAKK